MGDVLQFEEINYLNEHEKLGKYAKAIKGHEKFDKIKGANELIEDIIKSNTPLEKNIVLGSYKSVLGEIAEDITVVISRFGVLAMELLSEYESNLKKREEQEQVKQSSAWKYES